jgi:hypothetical protein
LVMRLETAAAKLERSRKLGDIDTAEHVDLLKEAARRIKELESGPVIHECNPHPRGWVHESYACGND